MLAIDDSLTRKMSASDAVQIAGTKGLVAGTVNVAIAFTLGFSMPDINTALIAGMIGFFGYGFSLVPFVLALRHLGAARPVRIFSLPLLSGQPSRYRCWTKRRA